MNLIEQIIDIRTGEVTERVLNELEVANLNKLFLETENEKKKNLAEEAAKEAARQSAFDKLAALGLTPEEISAITGS